MATLTELTDATNALLATITTLSNQYTSMLELESTTTGFLTDWDNTGRDDGEVPIWNAAAGKYQHSALSGVYETPAGAQAKADAAEADAIASSVAGLATKQATLSGASLTAVTPASADKILLQDASDSSNLKTATAQEIADLSAGDYVHIITTDVSVATSSVVFNNTVLDGTYPEYIFVFSKLAPATDSVTLRAQISDDNAATWETGAIYQQSTSAATWMSIGGVLGNTSGYVGITGSLHLLHPNSATDFKPAHLGRGVTQDNTGNADPIGTTNDGIVIEHTNAINGIKFYMSSGDIASGSIAVYGRKRA